MKRAISIILLLALCTTLFACGGGNSSTPTPFDKISTSTSRKEVFSTFGEPDIGDEKSEAIAYWDIKGFEAFGLPTSDEIYTELAIIFDKYNSVEWARWDYDYERKSFSYEQLEKDLSKIEKVYTAKYGKPTIEKGVYIWYDKAGNSYAVAGQESAISVFFNHTEAPLSWRK